MFLNDEGTDVKKEGDILKNPKLLETLELIAKHGSADPLYNGALTESFAADIQENGYRKLLNFK